MGSKLREFRETYKEVREEQEQSEFQERLEAWGNDEKYIPSSTPMFSEIELTNSKRMVGRLRE